MIHLLHDSSWISTSLEYSICSNLDRDGKRLLDLVDIRRLEILPPSFKVRNVGGLEDLRHKQAMRDKARVVKNAV